MQTADSKIFRTPVKHQKIVGMLKSEIVNGTFPPGSRMPTRDDLKERFSVSRITVQLAMDRLRREGFVITNGRNGTTVAEQPPHLFHYGIVYPGRPTRRGSPWLRYWEAIDQEVKALTLSGPRRFTSYYNFNGHIDEPDYVRLKADLHGQRLVGVFFIQLFNQYMDMVMDEAPNMPYVALAGKPHREMPIIVSESGFLTKALDHLKSRGRKRIAFVTGPRTVLMQGVDQMLAERDMSTESYWQLQFHLEMTQPARQVLELLMRAGNDNRPDGIIITDDNIVEQATMGLAASGVRIPEQLDVVAHCNFPWPTPSYVPSRRLGFDARRIIATAIARLDEQRQGQTTVPVSMIPLQFEDELSAQLVGEESYPSTV